MGDKCITKQNPDEKKLNLNNYLDEKCAMNKARNANS